MICSGFTMSNTTMLKHDLDIPALLGRMPLFSALTADQLVPITAATRERRLAKGEMLFQKGDTPKGFFVIVFGQVKLAFPSSQGNEKVVEIIGPRQSFGEAVDVHGQALPALRRGADRHVCCCISPRTPSSSCWRRIASFARAMLAGLSMRLHSLVSDVESYSLRSSAQRVIGYLLQHCPRTASARAGSQMTLPTSKQVIASRLNLTPETLSRIFHDLAEAKLIEVHGRQITVPDLLRLREYDL